MRLLAVLLILLGTANFVVFFIGNNPHDPMSILAGTCAFIGAYVFPRLVKLL